MQLTIARAFLADHALFATILTPGDKAPAHLMLSHQLRSLSSSLSIFADVVVLDNPGQDAQLPEMEEKRNRDLAQVVQLGARVHRVNDSLLKDTSFLSRFVKLDPRTSTGSLAADLLALLSQWEPRRLSYLAGILSFLNQCLFASTAIGLCVFLDADILLHRGEKGLLDLAPPIFRQNPELAVLQPPTVCHSHVNLDRSGNCGVRNWWWNSGRHMIFNRSRLLDILPLPVQPRDFGAGLTRVWQYAGFSNMFSSAARKQKWIGWMQCGAETFAIHPDRDLQTSQQMKTHHIITRLQQGKFEAPTLRGQLLARFHKVEPLSNMSIWWPAFKAAWGQTDALATNMCQDMFASLTRINAGMAW